MARAVVAPELAPTLNSFNFVYATTARPRGMTKDVMTPEQASADMHARIERGEKLAILFGRERIGLTNDEVSLADVIITAPVNPAYASLNIAQAVLLVGYEWFKPIAPSLGMETQELAATSTVPCTRAVIAFSWLPAITVRPKYFSGSMPIRSSVNNGT